jgi:predicted anti-sigma-YlaC factor YlaD
MNINVNGISVSVKQYEDGSFGASYTTEFAPDGDIHAAIAAAIGAQNWQVTCIGGSAPWAMNTGGDATWVMDFDINPDAVRAGVLLLDAAWQPTANLSSVEVLAAMRARGYAWTDEAGWVHTSQTDVLISLAHGS